MKNLLLFASLILSSTPALAAQVGYCMGVEDFKQGHLATKKFANGKILVTSVDTDGEPVCCSHHMMIQVKTPQGLICFLVSQKMGDGKDVYPTGYAQIDFDQLNASYEEGKGLHLKVPVYTYDFDNKNGGNPVPAGTAHALVNQHSPVSVRIIKDE